MHGMRVTALGLLQASAALTVLFSVVTLFDSVHHGIELFVHFRLQYLVVAFLLAITFAVLRRFMWGGALLLTAALNAYFVLPLYSGMPETADGASLKIMQVNVHSSTSNYHRVVETVTAESPDVVFLLETTDAWMTGTRELATEYAHHYAAPRVGNFGIAVYSRVPFDSVSHVNSPPLGYPTLVAKVSHAGRSITLIGTHPTIPLGRHGFDARNEQLRQIAGLAAESGDGTILVGDLNVSPWAHSFKTFLRESGLRDARRGFGVLPTWPVLMPFAMIPIDHMLLSDDITVLELRRGSRTGSDHLPLILTVVL